MSPHQAPVLFENSIVRATFSLSPVTPLQIDVQLTDNTTSLLTLPKSTFLQVFRCIRQLAVQLQRELAIARFGLVSEGGNLASLIPLHGIKAGAEWKPITTGDPVYYGTSFPGFISSRNGVKMDERELGDIRDALRAVSGLREENVGKSLIGEHDRSNLFARLIEEDIPCWKYHDTPDHVAFLTPFPNTTGYSCIIPKRHFSSNILGMPEEPYLELLETGWDVAQLFKEAFQVERVGFMMEGYEINHAHLKVVPIFDDCRVEGSHDTVWFDQYSGFLTSEKGKQLAEAEVKKLEDMAVSLRTKLAGLS
jgi:diadenosine tetraphosphate (Ap4A) HIT family hydrolase